MSIHPVGNSGEDRRQGENRALVKLVDPHFVIEKTKNGGRGFERIGLANAPIEPNSERDSGSDKQKRNEKHRLNQQMRIKVRGVSG